MLLCRTFHETMALIVEYPEGDIASECKGGSIIWSFGAWKVLNANRLHNQASACRAEGLCQKDTQC